MGDAASNTTTSVSEISPMTAWDNMQNDSLGAPVIDSEGETYRVVIQWLLVFVAVFTLFTNGLVVALVAKYRWLRNNKNRMIVSMCIGGVIDGVVLLPIIIVRGVTKIRSSAVCRIISISDIVIIMSSLLHLLAINIERYLAMKMPLKYKSLFIARMTLINIFIVWATSITGGVVVEFLFSNYTTHSGYCIPLPASQTNGIVISVVFFWLPFSITCTAYVNIYVIIRSHKRFMGANAGRQYQTQDGIYRVLLGVLGSSFLAFGPMATVPLFIHQIDAAKRETVQFYILPLCRLLIHTGIAVNPLVYALCGLEFRKAIAMLLCGARVSGVCPEVI